MATKSRKSQATNDRAEMIRPRVIHRTKLVEQARTERLDLRIAADVKGEIEQAAAIAGLPVSAFVLSVTVPHARRLISESQQITLSNRDRDRFFAALDDEDAKPNAALLRAAESFKAATR